MVIMRYIGLSEYETDLDGDTDSETYDDCDADECPDMDSAGLTGMIFLWIAVAAAIGSLVLMCLNNFNVYNSKFGMIACFVELDLLLLEPSYGCLCSLKLKNLMS